MNAKRLANGNIVVLRCAIGPNGERGHFGEEISVDDPRYQSWIGHIDEGPRPQRQPGDPIKGLEKYLGVSAEEALRLSRGCGYVEEPSAGPPDEESPR